MPEGPAAAPLLVHRTCCTNQSSSNLNSSSGCASTVDCDKGALGTGGLLVASVNALLQSEHLPKPSALWTTHPSGPTPTLGPLAWKHCHLGHSFSFALRLQTPSLTACTCLNLLGPLTCAELLEPLLQLLPGDAPATRWPAQQHSGEQKKQFPCSRVSDVVVPVSGALRFFESHPHGASECPPSETMGLSSSLWPSV